LESKEKKLLEGFLGREKILSDMKNISKQKKLFE
jgi:hypothetical protein